MTYLNRYLLKKSMYIKTFSSFISHNNNKGQIYKNNHFNNSMGIVIICLGIFSLQDNIEVCYHLNCKNVELILMLVIKGINKDYQYLHK